MRYIRETATGAFVVRVSHSGKQQHLGTFRTHAEAVDHRDRELTTRSGRRDHDARPSKRASRTTRGVYPRFAMQGMRYDVYRMIEGHTLYGGSYATRDEAARAHAELQLDALRAAVQARPTDKGIHVRYSGRRHESPRPRYVVRARVDGNRRHVGVFETLEEARAALNTAMP